MTLLSFCASSPLFCCQLPMGAPVSALFAELGDEPWDHRWWLRVIRFAGQLDAKPEEDLHREIMHDNVADARLLPAGGNWAAQIAQQCQALQLSAPVAVDGSVVISPISYRSRLLEQSHEFWASTHISPRTCPIKGAKCCTYQRCFARVGPVPEPYFELPLSRSSLGQLFRYRLGAHMLPVGMGRRHRQARVAQVCPHCEGGHVGDERQLHSASKACEDGSVFMFSASLRMADRQLETAFWSLCHMNNMMLRKTGADT